MGKHGGTSRSSSAVAKGRTRTSRKTASTPARAPVLTKPLPRPKPGLHAAAGPMQEKLTLTRAEQADYKELAAKRGTYERQIDVFGRMEARAASRGDHEGQKFYRLMGGFARSQLSVLADFDRKRAALKGQRASLRAEADAKKIAKMAGGKPRKPLAAAGSAQAWARANPDEVGREGAIGGANRSDVALDHIAAEMGYAVQPWTATKSQLSRMVSDYGAHEFYRGFSSRQMSGTREEAVARAKGYAQAFTKGAYRSGFGTYGSGYYVGGGEGARSTGHYYAQTGVVVRGAIISGARFADFGAMKQAMQREGNAYLRSHGLTPTYKPNEHFGSHEMHHGPDPVSRQLSAADRGEYTLRYGDVGRYAASKGIDVLGDPRGGYWVILNRGVMVVQRVTEKHSARIMQRG